MNALQVWMAEATPQEKKKLATLAKTTVGTLRVTAGNYRSASGLYLTAEFAQRLAEASVIVQRKGLPLLLPEELCATCASCWYQVQCNK